MSGARCGREPGERDRAQEERRRGEKTVLGEMVLVFEMVLVLTALPALARCEFHSVQT